MMCLCASLYCDLVPVHQCYFEYGLKILKLLEAVYYLLDHNNDHNYFTIINTCHSDPVTEMGQVTPLRRTLAAAP